MAWKVGKGEKVWECLTDTHGNPTHLVTSDDRRERYYLYRIKDGVPEKIGKAKTPPELYRRYLKGR